MPLSGQDPMNSRKLSKQKRNHLILVILAALIVLAGLYLGLIRRQYESLTRLAQQKEAADRKLKTVVGTIHQADRIKAETEEARSVLAQSEADVASGDLYAWVINSLRQFKGPYKVDVPQFSQIGAVDNVNLLPNFPYKQAVLTIAGTAYFHDLGRFIADFENQFPHVRLLNLSLDANAPSSSAQSEALSFRMDIVTLVKVNPS
jgi:Tfp pilus assembly protein PilO